MPTIDNDSLGQQVHHAGEYGNMASWGPRFPFAKAGVLLGDVLRLHRIPSGSRVDDFKLVHDAAGATVTCKVGYEPVNSTDGPTADDDFWLPAGTSIAAAGVARSLAHPITFDFDVYVILTTAGANFTGSPKLTSVVSGEHVGTK